MKTKSSPSRYRNCISRLSMTACSSFSSPRNVRSTWPPVRVLRNVVRTKAPPLPGFTCWKSTTWNSPSGRSRDMPRFRSLLETAAIVGSSSSELGGEREGPAALGGDDDGVLDADAAVTGTVDARFHRHHMAGRERCVHRGG